MTAQNDSSIENVVRKSPEVRRFAEVYAADGNVGLQMKECKTDEEVVQLLGISPDKVVNRWIREGGYTCFNVMTPLRYVGLTGPDDSGKYDELYRQNGLVVYVDPLKKEVVGTFEWQNALELRKVPRPIRR